MLNFTSIQSLSTQFSTQPTILPSVHGSIVQFSFADGSIRPIPVTIDRETFKSLSGMADGRIVNQKM